MVVVHMSCYWILVEYILLIKSRVRNPRPRRTAPWNDPAMHGQTTPYVLPAGPIGGRRHNRHRPPQRHNRAIPIDHVFHVSSELFMSGTVDHSTSFLCERGRPVFGCNTRRASYMFLGALAQLLRLRLRRRPADGSSHDYSSSDIHACVCKARRYYKKKKCGKDMRVSWSNDKIS